MHNAKPFRFNVNRSVIFTLALAVNVVLGAALMSLPGYAARNARPVELGRLAQVVVHPPKAVRAALTVAPQNTCDRQSA